MMFTIITDLDGVQKPIEPKVGDVIMMHNGEVQVYTHEGWVSSSNLNVVSLVMKLQTALEVYADPDNWIGNEFWAEGGGDPKRFAREALKK